MQLVKTKLYLMKGGDRGSDTDSTNRMERGRSLRKTAVEEPVSNKHYRRPTSRKDHEVNVTQLPASST